MLYDFDALTFGILTIARFSHSAGVFEVGERDFASLSLLTHGTARITIGGSRLLAHRGDVLFIPAGIAFTVEYSLSESISVHLLDCNYRTPELFSPHTTHALPMLFSEMLQDFGERRSVNRAKAAVYTILERLSEDQSAEEAQTAFDKCRRYMDENFSDPTLDMAAVCSRGFISTSSLRRACIAALGESPMQYVIRLRMEKAARLLGENRLSVKEIAYLCGFSDEKYFSRAFRKHYGCSPSQLRDDLAFLSDLPGERHFSRMLMAREGTRKE